VTRGTIAIHGLGLIGGSLGLALRALPDAPRVVGFDADPATAGAALEGGAVEALLPTAEAAVPGLVLAVTAVPPRAATALVPKLLASLPEGALLTDLSSVMLPVLRAAGATASGRFVGSHPLRGSEQGGFRAARGAR
jgi:prephenate dehydrogenase